MPRIENIFQAQFPPRHSRIHEVYGANALSFALGIWAYQKDKTIWICKDARDVPNDLSLRNIQFIFISDQKSQLWCLEEGLRSGVVSLVVSVHDKAVGFTPMRRLQLAAETGGATGLIITTSDQTSPASETRWQCEPVYSPKGEAWQIWKLLKNKQGILGEWKVRWNEETHRVTLV